MRETLFRVSTAWGLMSDRLPIGVVQIILWGVVLLIGWLIGGPVGIGTVVSTFGSGIVMQIVYSIIKFEPRNIEHRSVIDVVKSMRTEKSYIGETNNEN